MRDEDEAGKTRRRLVIRLLGKRLPLHDVTGDQQVVVLLVEIFQRLRGQPFIHSDDHLIPHPTVGVKHFVEVLDFIHGTIHVVCDGEEMEVRAGDESEFQQVIVQEPAPGLPIESIGSIH